MKRSLSVALSALAIAAGLTATPSTQAAIVAPTPNSQSTLKGERLISQTFRPPNLGSPPSTAGGATRGGACFQDSQRFTALLPPTQIGLTVSNRPTFFWYLPESTATTAQFLLLNQDSSQVVYETTLDLPSRAGIVSFTLPPAAKPLEVGQRYHWFLVVDCNPLDRNSNPSAEGWVERVAPSPALSEKLRQTSERGLPALYADQGIWFEALTALAQQRQANPADTSLVADWGQLLKSVDLGSLAGEPLLDSLSTRNAGK